jgi:hypothetical protein
MELELAGAVKKCIRKEMEFKTKMATEKPIWDPNVRNSDLVTKLTRFIRVVAVLHMIQLYYHGFGAS